MSDGPVSPESPSVRDLERIHRELEEIDQRVAAEERTVISRGYEAALEADLQELRASEGPLYDALPLPVIPPPLVESVLPGHRLFGLLAAPIGESTPLWWSFLPWLGMQVPGAGRRLPIRRRTWTAILLDDRGLLHEGDLVHDSADPPAPPRVLDPLHDDPDGARWGRLLPHGRVRELRGLRPLDPEGWLGRAGEAAPALPELMEWLQAIVHAALVDGRETLRERITERVADLESRRRRLERIRSSRHPASDS